jgi:hypothetical protein
MGYTPPGETPDQTVSRIRATRNNFMGDCRHVVTQGCRPGVADEQYNLGVVYRQGIGVSIRWLNPYNNHQLRIWRHGRASGGGAIVNPQGSVRNTDPTFAAAIDASMISATGKVHFSNPSAAK